MMQQIKMGDYVKHIPTGEEWVVCGINYKRGELIPAGYPFPSIAQITDCELTQSNEPNKIWDAEYRRALKEANMESYI